MAHKWQVTVEQINTTDVDAGNITVWRVTTISSTGTKSVSVALQLEDVGALVVKLMMAAIAQ